MEPRDLVTGVIRLVSLPDIFIRINEMIDDPTRSAADFARIISHDPALSARLLQIANSPLYGFPSRVDTISRAVTIIGTKGLRYLTLATSTIEIFSKLSTDEIDIDHFWRHSLYCAVVSRLLAAKCNTLNSEAFFVSGLLHDIGQLVILHKLPEMARDTRRRAAGGGQHLHQIEREIIGFDHAQVGGELLRLWKLPGNIQNAVEFHHVPQDAQQPFCASIVHIANALAMAEQMQADTLEDNLEVESAAWDITALDRSCMESVQASARIQFADMVNLFLAKAA